MSRTLSALAALAPSFVAAQQAPRDTRIDAAHSTVAFSIGFLGFPVRGRFDDTRGTIAYVRGNVPASSVSIVIGTASITTGSVHRDDHLKTSDFFDAARYPIISFHSRAVERAGAAYLMKGTLTMHGVTRDVAIPFRETQAPVEDSHGSTLVFFSGALRIARKDFGILGGSRFNSWFDAARSATMSDSVDIELNIEAWDPDYTRDHTFDASVARADREGMDSTIARLNHMRAQSPDTLRGAEWQLIQIARVLSLRNKHDDAVKLMKFVTQVFPSSATSWAARSRAEELGGDRAAALVSATKAAGLDSLDTQAAELLRRLKQRGG